MDEATRKAIQQAAAQAEQRGLEMSRKENEAMKKVLADNGMKVLQPGPELKAGLTKIGDQMATEWAKTAGAEGQQILEAFRK